MYESRIKERSVKITILVLTMAILIGNIPIGSSRATDSESDTTLMEDNLVSQNEAIVVTGGFYDTQLSPLVNYSVEVYHSVPGADELLAKNITTENGSFFIRIPLPNEIKEGIFLGLFNKFTKFSGCFYDKKIPTDKNETDLGDLIVDVSCSTLPSSGDSVTVYGSFEYEDGNGDSHPIRNAYGNVWDDIVGLDNLLANFHTNENGDFSVNIRDPYFGQHFDIYAKAYSIDEAYFLGDVGVGNSLGIAYEIKTQTIQNVGAGQTKNLEDNSPGTTKTNKAFHIYEVLQRSHDFAENQGGVNMGGVNAAFPSTFELYDFLTNTIHLHENSGFSTYAIAHEYGHAIMDEVYGNLQAYPGIPPTTHWFYTQDDDAIVEGWAEFFGFLIENEVEKERHNHRGERDWSGIYEYHRGERNPDNFNDYSGDSFAKPDTWMTAYIGDDWDGNKVEGSVMKILYDLWDDTPDETINGIDLDGNEWNQYEDFLGKDSINLNFGDIIDVLDTEPDSIMDMYPHFANKVEEHHLRSLYFNNGIRDFDDDGDLWENQHAPTLDSISPGGGTYGGWIGDVDEQCSELLYSSKSIYRIRFEQEEC